MKRSHYRDRAHREIILEALSCFHDSDGALYLKTPLDLGTISFWGDCDSIILAGVDCNNGRLFDQQERIIRYQDVPLLLLLKIHRLIVKKKQYEFKEENH